MFGRLTPHGASLYDLQELHAANCIRALGVHTAVSQTNPLQEAHAALFSMPQGKANMWIHTLLPVTCATLRLLGDAQPAILRILPRD